jgi:hypothetical protein
MAPIIPDQALPRRSESGMTTRAVNAAAGVILAAMQQDRRTPTGLAIALDSACLLNSPEHAAEVVELRAENTELKEQRERRRIRLIALQNDAMDMRGSLAPNGEERKVPFPLGKTLTPAVDWLIARVAELEAAAYGDAEVRLLNPVEQIQHLHACVAAQMSRADTLDRLCREQRARADQAEEQLAAKDRPVDEDPIVYALTDKAAQLPAAPRVRHLRELLDRQCDQTEADGITRRIAPTQALQLEDPHDSPLHHTYRVGHDLPTTGGAS